MQPPPTLSDIRRQVALHPEGVDRNSRRTSTEMFSRVALHPEGVDRNLTLPLYACRLDGRPPPGGRG